MIKDSILRPYIPHQKPRNHKFSLGISQICQKEEKGRGGTKKKKGREGKGIEERGGERKQRGEEGRGEEREILYKFTSFQVFLLGHIQILLLAVTHRTCIAQVFQYAAEPSSISPTQHAVSPKNLY